MTFETNNLTGTLDNWATRAYNPYAPPEFGQIVEGEVYGHPKRPDGQKITTSIITEIQGRHIMTSSGSVYLLGKPNEHFIRFCEEQGGHVPTADEPIKIIDLPTTEIPETD